MVAGDGAVVGLQQIQGFYWDAQFSRWQAVRSTLAGYWMRDGCIFIPAFLGHTGRSAVHVLRHGELSV